MTTQNYDPDTLPPDCDPTSPEFNWLAALQRAAALRLDDSNPEFAQLCYRANSWPTCACGQLCAALPRDCLDSPHDSILRCLGLKFNNAVHNAEWKHALATFTQIEHRAAQLLGATAK